ncbi:MAG: zinc ribbon domain-containing protein [Chloroflexi bacterium]|nr:zinc ribbon domain-containing protein [Chloroflexota bacterium]
MPLYEYHCQTCRTTFELLRPMNDSSEPSTCPAGHSGATRVVSLVAARAKEGDDMTAGGGCACSAGGACGCSGH